jgi:hypothetical protein
MAIIKSGATSDQLTVDPTSKAARATIYDALGNSVDTLEADSSGTTNGLGVSLMATNFVLSALGKNSSTSQLTNGSTFTGTIENVYNAQAVSVLLTSDQAGTLTLNQYIDAGGVYLVASWAFTIAAGTPFNRSFVLNGNYFNLTFHNTGGSTTTTLNINTAYGILPASTNLGNAPVALNEVGGLAVVAAAKGSQPTNFLPTQDAKDSGRTFVTMTVDTVAGITAKALASLSINKAGVVTTATNYTVAAGKTLRVQEFDASVKLSAATYSNIEAWLLATSSGTVATTSPVMDLLYASPPLASTGAIGTDTSDYPDGMEIPAGYNIGVAHLESSTFSSASLVLVGYEY